MRRWFPFSFPGLLLRPCLERHQPFSCYGGEESPLILNNFNASTFSGAKIYAAYGFIPGEGAGQGRTSVVYTVP